MANPSPFAMVNQPALPLATPPESESPRFGITSVLSLAAFLLSLVYTYVLSDGGKVMSQTVTVTSAVIAILLLLFVMYSQAQAARGVLR